MAKTKSNSNIPQHEIEALARCLLPDIIAFYETEEGKREFEEWRKQKENLITNQAKEIV